MEGLTELFVETQKKADGLKILMLLYSQNFSEIIELIVTEILVQIEAPEGEDVNIPIRMPAVSFIISYISKEAIYHFCHLDNKIINNIGNPRIRNSVINFYPKISDFIGSDIEKLTYLLKYRHTMKSIIQKSDVYIEDLENIGRKDIFIEEIKYILIHEPNIYKIIPSDLEDREYISVKIKSDIIIDIHITTKDFLSKLNKKRLSLDNEKLFIYENVLVGDENAVFGIINNKHCVPILGDHLDKFSPYYIGDHGVYYHRLLDLLEIVSSFPFELIKSKEKEKIKYTQYCKLADIQFNSFLESSSFYKNLSPVEKYFILKHQILTTKVEINDEIETNKETKISYDDDEIEISEIYPGRYYITYDNRPKGERCYYIKDVCMGLCSDNDANQVLHEGFEGDSDVSSLHATDEYY